MKDTLEETQLRHDLVEILRGKGITDQKVLTAIDRVPRHLFVDSELTLHDLYEDQPLPIGKGQTISQPYTVAY